MSKKKIITLERLAEYHESIKLVMLENLATILVRANSFTNDMFAKFTDGTTEVAKSSDSGKLGGQLPSYYAKATDIPTGTLASKSMVSESDLDSNLAQKVNAASQGNHSHSNTSVLDGITSTKVSNWDSAESKAKAYTDEKIALIMENPTEAVDSVMELVSAMNGNADAIEALTEIAGSKVPTSRKINGKALTADITLSIADIANLQTTLNNASSAISANTSSITGHTTRIGDLEAKVGDGFEEVTSAEIQNLFSS